MQAIADVLPTVITERVHYSGILKTIIPISVALSIIQMGNGNAVEDNITAAVRDDLFIGMIMPAAKITAFNFRNGIHNILFIVVEIKRLGSGAFASEAY